MLQGRAAYRDLPIEQRCRTAYVLGHLMVGRTRLVQMVGAAVAGVCCWIFASVAMVPVVGLLEMADGLGVVATLLLLPVCVLAISMVVPLAVAVARLPACWLGRWLHAELLTRAIAAANGEGSCLACGYDLRGTVGRACPECGGHWIDLTRDPPPGTHMPAARRKLAADLLGPAGSFDALPAHRRAALATELSHRVSDRPVLLIRMAVLLTMTAVCIILAVVGTAALAVLTVDSAHVAIRLSPAAVFVGFLLIVLAFDRLLLMPALRRWLRPQIEAVLAGDAA